MKTRFNVPLFPIVVFLALAAFSCTKEEGPEIDESSRDISLEARSEGAGAVYLIDNDVNDNKVIAFRRSADGGLSSAGTYSTGGQGTGGGLGSQGAVVLYRQFLYVCNPGSNEISVFDTRGQGLRLVDIESSEGQMPVSLTVRRNLLYVLNAGGSGNIAGFQVSNQGDISFLPGSVQPLSSDAAGGAQVSFDRRALNLVVTEKATNRISVYPVGPSGLAGAPASYPSAGQTPFGFEFSRQNRLVISEAFGGAPGASTLSSYNLSSGGNLQLIDGPVATNQTAACWVAITNDGRFTYATNTGSASVTGYRISSSGDLELLDDNGVSGTTGAGPIDMAFSRNSSFLYTLNAGDDSITLFERHGDGSLTSLGEVSGLPNGAAGMAAE